jgi:hypothetical protein
VEKQIAEKIKMVEVYEENFQYGNDDPGLLVQSNHQLFNYAVFVLTYRTYSIYF